MFCRVPSLATVYSKIKLTNGKVSVATPVATAKQVIIKASFVIAWTSTLWLREPWKKSVLVSEERTRVVPIVAGQSRIDGGFGPTHQIIN
jgi:hypothetical protein